MESVNLKRENNLTDIAMQFTEPADDSSDYEIFEYAVFCRTCRKNRYWSLTGRMLKWHRCPVCRNMIHYSMMTEYPAPAWRRNTDD